MKALLIFLFFCGAKSMLAKEIDLVNKPFSIHDKPQKKFTNAKKNFEKVKDLILEDYIDKNISEEDLYLLATQGILFGLNKAEKSGNQLLTPNQVENMNINLQGRVKGIGVALRYLDETGTAIVMAFTPNSVAEKSGLKLGDTILRVDGKSFKGKPFASMVDEIRGPVGKSVSLKILRGDKILMKKVVRKEVTFPQVSGEILKGDVGLLRVSHFSNSSVTEIRNELMKFKKAKVKKLVLDLRENMGGVFESSIKTADFLLKKDKVIVVAKGKMGKTEVFKSKENPILEDIQIIVLTSEGTSSGAELLTMALKENVNAKIVGQKTSGKWNVQQLVNLSNGYAIKFTVYRFETASGKSFEDTGVVPDIELKARPFSMDGSVQPKDNNSDAGLRAALNLLQAS